MVHLIPYLSPLLMMYHARSPWFSREVDSYAKYRIKIILLQQSWRDAGVVERGGLENRCALHGHRGFESLSLRKRIKIPRTAGVGDFYLDGSDENLFSGGDGQIKTLIHACVNKGFLFFCWYPTNGITSEVSNPSLSLKYNTQPDLLFDGCSVRVNGRVPGGTLHHQTGSLICKHDSR